MRQTRRVAEQHNMSIDLKKLKDKFFTDPDWKEMEELIRSYIDPLESCLDINPQWSSDQIATEVRGRQLMYKGLNDFLEQTGVLRPRIINKPTTFK